MGTLGIGFFAATGYITALIPLLFGFIIAGAGGLSIWRPSLNAMSMHIAFFVSTVSALLGLITALTGSWVTTTSLIEQILMSAIGGGHVVAGYGAYSFGQASTDSADLACGKSDVETSGSPARSAIKSISYPDERILPAASFMIVTD